MIITPHFIREEFDCRDGTPYPKEWIGTRLMPLCLALETIRTEIGPLHILSGYRTPEHNKVIGGASHSQHMEGRAADIVCRTKPILTLYEAILELIRTHRILDGGVGIYHSWVHYDQGPAGRRWRI